MTTIIVNRRDPHVLKTNADLAKITPTQIPSAILDHIGGLHQKNQADFFSKYNAYTCLKSIPPEKKDINITKRVVDLIGHLTLKSIFETPLIKEELHAIFTQTAKTLFDLNYFERLEDSTYGLNNLKEAETKYNNKPFGDDSKPDFKQKLQEWEAIWVVAFSCPDSGFESIIVNNADHKYFNLTAQNTFADYITAIRKIPIEIKISAGI